MPKRAKNIYPLIYKYKKSHKQIHQKGEKKYD